MDLENQQFGLVWIASIRSLFIRFEIPHWNSLVVTFNNSCRCRAPLASLGQLRNGEFPCGFAIDGYSLSFLALR